jgi:hypothetical protein
MAGMTLAESLATDPGFLALDTRKAIAVELIVKELDAIKRGDEHYPSHWLRIIDICRQEAGIARMSAIN